ncbi:Uncharacterised protein [Legionella busanensis]|uniref:Lipoprotein n=1 Tax=Legionella busanensis TaxID=190655 RepID=A0A378JK22_9GAMM|nr:hypothetical protein [Legionella busanensis]STX51038.1 Uncharacterised protein [Legionella busanensis]
MKKLLIAFVVVSSTLAMTGCGCALFGCAPAQDYTATTYVK